MNEPNDTAAAVPTPPVPPTPPPTPPATRGSANQAYLNEIKDAKKVAKSATKPAFASLLAEVEMDATLPDQVNTLTGTVTKNLTKIKSARSGGKTMTKQETVAREALFAALNPIQTAAKRQFEGDDALLRENYGIGEGLASLRLDQIIIVLGGILARLSPGENNTPPQDVLPGIKPPQIQALSDAIDTYGGKNEAQGEQQFDAASLLEQVKLDIATLAGLRRKIQLAADQAWPWRTKGVATIRKQFLLPVDRPLTD